MVIADEREELLGMTMYGPYRVQLFDRVGVAARGRAAVLAPQLRRSGRSTTVVDETDPLYLLSRASRPYIDERGWEFTFGLPNPRMLRRREKSIVPEEGIMSFQEYGRGLRVDIK